MILTDCIADAIVRLKTHGIDNPQLDARLLIGYVLGLDRAQLLSQAQRILSDAETTSIHTLLTRRTHRESLARIIGVREFWGLDFRLNEATLEPRPDSEVLIETILAFHKQDCRILDLGTGTGCLLLSVLHDIPSATGVGIDISTRAVEQATQNAAALGLSKRASFQTGNWLTGLSGKFDIIISNPPYISASDIPKLMPEVRDYDPMLALNGGADGLMNYRLFIPLLADYLTSQGIIAFECGAGQAQQIVEMLAQNEYKNITKHKDLAGIERCISAMKKGE